MANTIAVLEGGFGSVGQYWMTTMKASQVINSIYMPKDIPEWKKEGNTCPQISTEPTIAPDHNETCILASG